MVIQLPRWKGKVAVVTGASAGIGAAIVEQLVEAGLKVVGLARRVEKVQEIAKKLEGKPGKLYAFQADVTKEEDIIKAFKWITENVGPVHILVNNAGVARNTTLINGDANKWREVLNTNVLGLSICTDEAAKIMQANNIDGHIIHINSVAGHQVGPFPNLNVYSAAKFAVTALTETLRHELNFQKSKIKVTSVSPGVVRTEFLDASGLTIGSNLNFDELPYLKSEDVADAVLYVLSTPPHVMINELTIKPVGEMF